MGLLVGPFIGPIIGGFVLEYLGWRWAVRPILISVGLITLATVVFLRESDAAVLLRWKTSQLHKKIGNDKLVPKFDRAGTPLQTLSHSIVRPVTNSSRIGCTLLMYCT